MMPADPSHRIGAMPSDLGFVWALTHTWVLHYGPDAEGAAAFHMMMTSEPHILILTKQGDIQLP